jgi:hypothetical protein
MIPIAPMRFGRLSPGCSAGEPQRRGFRLAAASYRWLHACRETLYGDMVYAAHANGFARPSKGWSGTLHPMRSMAALRLFALREFGALAGQGFQGLRGCRRRGDGLWTDSKTICKRTTLQHKAPARQNCLPCRCSLFLWSSQPAQVRTGSHLLVEIVA